MTQASVNGDTRVAAEEKTIGIITFYGADAVNESITAGLKPAMFRDEQLGRIYSAAIAACSHGEVNRETIWSRLDNRTDDDMQRLIVASMSAPDCGPIGRRDVIAEIVDSWRRDKCLTSLALASEAIRASSRWRSGFNDASAHIRAAMDCGAGQTTKNLKTLAQEAHDKMRRKLAHEGIDGLSTGFLDWDRCCMPIGREFVVLAGRPSTGKSSLAAQLAGTWMAIEREKAVAYFSVEDPGSELIERMVVQTTGINISEAHTKSEAEREKWLETALKFGNLSSRFHVFEGQTNVDEIEAKCRMLHSGIPLSAIIIDYLQLIDPPRVSRSDGRTQQVGMMTRRLKLLSVALGVPVILLAQLNRESEKGGENREPQMTNLRESGDIEQDADRVWLLWRPDNRADGQPQDDGMPTVDVVWKQAKMRGGPRIKGWFSFDKPHLSFSWRPIISKFIPGGLNAK